MKIVGSFLLSLATDKVVDEGPTQIFKKMDGSWLQIRVSLLSRPFESWKKRLTEDRIRYSLEKHGRLEGFQVVDGVDGPIIDLELR